MATPPSARRARATATARGVLEAWRRSGLPLERFAKQKGLVAQRLRWWKQKFEFQERALATRPAPALLPVRIAETPRRGESVTVLLRSGHMLKSRMGSTKRRSRASSPCSRAADVRAAAERAKIYFATALTDMRKGIDGLRAIVEDALRHDPYEGHLFVFVGRSKDKVKILFWDRSGFVLYMNRLEKGRCRRSTPGASTSPWTLRSSRCFSTGSILTHGVLVAGIQM